jgi:hypothetical protein
VADAVVTDEASRARKNRAVLFAGEMGLYDPN